MKRLFLVIVFVLWSISIYIVYNYTQTTKDKPNDTLSESIEIPLAFKKNLILYYKEKPFAYIVAELVPNRFKSEMLYYLHIDAQLALQLKSQNEMIQSKGFVLFKSSYDLLKMKLDVTGKQAQLIIKAKTNNGMIFVEVLFPEIHSKPLQFTVPVLFWQHIIRSFIASHEAASFDILDKQVTYGDFILKASEESKPELFYIDSKVLLQFSTVLQRSTYNESE